ncbi:Phosphatidylinositol transfer protein 3 [Bienertia sinuspersici]
MGKIKEVQQKSQKTKVDVVLDILRKQSPLSLKQEKFCNTACVERFLKVKGENVKKAAKLLKGCLTWRDTIGTENLIADEFSGELAEGVAYVAGHDEECRPVIVFRIKQDYHKFHSQKLFTRLMVFTLEVAVQTMPRNVEQFVILFDASFFRSASAFMNIVLPTLKIVAEYYPARLHKAFVIDPPSLFPYLWKGVRPFIELSNITTIVSSTDFEDSISLDYNDFSLYPRAASLRFDPSSTAKIGSCASSRFSFTVSHHFDSLKPWYLSLTSETPSATSTSSKVGPTTTPTNSTSPSILGPNPRSFSFASPIDRVPRGNPYINNHHLLRKNFIPSTPLPQKSHNADVAGVKQPRTPKASFLHSPAAALFGRRETPAQVCHISSKSDKSKEAFYQYFKFYRRPYDEMIYRSKMKPPLGGLISIVAPHHVRRRHLSVSQRF